MKTNRDSTKKPLSKGRVKPRKVKRKVGTMMKVINRVSDLTNGIIAASLFFILAFYYAFPVIGI